jgi:hypothetical protein
MTIDSALVAALVAALGSNSLDDVGSLLTQVGATLPGRRRFFVESVSSLEQCTGALFTGGRSTPVFKVAVRCREEEVDRRFVIKIVRGGHSQRVFRSYVVESNFYANGCASAFRAASLTLPRLVATGICAVDPPPADAADPLLTASEQATAFCFVMRDLESSHSAHSDCKLTSAQAICAVAYLARWHSIGWGLALDDADRVDLWPAGAFWSEAVWPLATTTTAGAADAAWAASLRYLAKASQHHAHPSMRALGRRLFAARPLLDRFLSTGRAAAPKKGTRSGALAPATVLHGDFKAANLFFDGVGTALACRSAAAAWVHVASCDFQFVGSGLGARDLAYLACWDHFDLIDSGELVGTYVAALHAGLREREERANEELEKACIASVSKTTEETQRRALAVLSCDAASLSRSYGEASAALHLGFAFASYFAYKMLERGFVCSTPGDIDLVTRVERALAVIDGGKVVAVTAMEAALGECCRVAREVDEGVRVR